MGQTGSKRPTGFDQGVQPHTFLVADQYHPDYRNWLVVLHRYFVAQ